MGFIFKPMDNGTVTTTTESVETTFVFNEDAPEQFKQDAAEALMEVLIKHNKTGSTVTLTVE